MHHVTVYLTLSDNAAKYINCQAVHILWRMVGFSEDETNSRAPLKPFVSLAGNFLQFCSSCTSENAVGA